MAEITQDEKDSRMKRRFRNIATATIAAVGVSVIFLHRDDSSNSLSEQNLLRHHYVKIQDAEEFARKARTCNDKGGLVDTVKGKGNEIFFRCMPTMPKEKSRPNKNSIAV